MHLTTKSSCLFISNKLGKVRAAYTTPFSLPCHIWAFMSSGSREWQHYRLPVIITFFNDNLVFSKTQPIPSNILKVYIRSLNCVCSVDTTVSHFTIQIYWYLLRQIVMESRKIRRKYGGLKQILTTFTDLNFFETNIFNIMKLYYFECHFQC